MSSLKKDSTKNTKQSDNTTTLDDLELCFGVAPLQAGVVNHVPEGPISRENYN